MTAYFAAVAGRSKKDELRRLGGLSALILAAAYLVGLVLNFTLLDTSIMLDPVEKVSFLCSWQRRSTSSCGPPRRLWRERRRPSRSSGPAS
jgi:hypothetical protein